MPFRVSGMAVIHAPVLLARVAWRFAAGVASASKLASVSSAAAVRALVVSLRPSLIPARCARHSYAEAVHCCRKFDCFACDQYHRHRVQDEQGRPYFGKGTWHCKRLLRRSCASSDFSDDGTTSKGVLAKCRATANTVKISLHLQASKFQIRP